MSYICKNLFCHVEIEIPGLCEDCMQEAAIAVEELTHYGLLEWRK